MSKPKQEKDLKIPSDILNELLTSSEQRMLKNRWQILKLLEDGLSIRQVASQAKVGTDTVVRVARMTDKQSLRKKLNQNQSVSGESRWIFGKSE